MPRRKAEAPAADVLDADAEQQTGAAMDAMRDSALAVSQQHAHVRAVADQVGYQLPSEYIDPDLIQRDIAANMRRSVEACLEVGRGLTVLKEACGHGNFLARLEVLSLDHSVAKRFMQAARKFSNGASTHLLKAAGNQTKLFEMLVLDDEQIEELQLTGQTGELKLDDIATMSVKELRAALRDAREDGKAKDDLLAEKNRRLDEERAKAKRIQALPADDVMAELVQETGKYSAEALGLIQGTLRQAFVKLAEHQQANGGTNLREVMAGHVDQLQWLLIELREEFHLPDHVGNGTPEWMRATDGDADIAGKAN